MNKTFYDFGFTFALLVIGVICTQELVKQNRKEAEQKQIQELCEKVNYDFCKIDKIIYKK